MRFYFRVICAVLVILFSIINVSAAEERETKRVLILAGHIKNQPAVKLVEKGIEQVFQSNTDYRIKVDIEYLDLYRFTSKHYKQEIVDLLRHKYGDSKIDVVITILTSALRFMLDYGGKIFPDIPTIFTVVSEPTLTDLSLPGNVTGISYELDIKGTLETALKLQPNTKHVVLVAGVSKTIGGMGKKAKKIFQSYKDDLQFTYLTGHSMNQILEQVARMPEDTIIFNLGMYRDKAGNVFVPREAMSKIVGKSTVPSYGVFETFLGHGIVGGRLASYEVQGRKAAQYALAILKGKKPSDLPVTNYETIVPMFDWRQLKKWGLDEERLPDGSIVRFKEFTTWGEHKWYFIGGISLFIIEAILILLLLFNWARRLKAESALKNSHKELELRVKERTGELAKANDELKRKIDERNQAEGALRESEEKFRNLYENSPFGIFVCQMLRNEKGEFSDFIHIEGNQSIHLNTGFELNQLTGKKASEIVDSKVLTELVELYGSVISTGKPIQYEQHFDVYDRTLDVTAFRLHNDLFIINFINISERKRAEEELIRLRLYLKNMFDSMPSVLVGVDQDGLVTQWNQETEKLTGLPDRDAKGKPLDKVLPQLTSQMEQIKAAISLKEPQMTQKVVRQEDGETRYSDIMVYPLVSNGVEGAVVRVDDVTDRVRLEQMMIQTEKMMSVGGLAAGMAHEINNPLGAILQGIQNTIRRVSLELEANQKVAKQCGADLETVRRYLENRGILKYFEGMREAGTRAARIVSNMLDFSRRSESKLAPTEINELMDSVLELADSDYDLLKKYDFRHVKIKRDYGTGLSQVPCTATEIEQVFLNLIRNAAEAMVEVKNQKEGPRLTLKTRKEEDHALIEIEDNGPGMDENTRKRVFEPFFTTKPVGVGTGLGLSVSYFIITNNHNGTMFVESDPDKGTKFIIRLPLERKES